MSHSRIRTERMPTFVSPELTPASFAVPWPPRGPADESIDRPSAQDETWEAHRDHDSRPRRGCLGNWCRRAGISRETHQAKCRRDDGARCAGYVSNADSVPHRPISLTTVWAAPPAQPRRHSPRVEAAASTSLICFLAGPIRRASVMFMKTRFELTMDGRGRAPFGTVLDLLSRHVDVDPPLLPADAACPVW